MKLNLIKAVILCPALIATSMYSCKDDITVEENNPIASSEEQLIDDRILSLYSTNHKLSKQQAMDYALNANKIMESYGRLKKGKIKSIAGVSALTSGSNGLKSLKSSGTPDTTAYIFNYADNEGFAIISADDRIGNPIIAYVDKGNYNADSLNDVQLNLMNDISAYVDYSIDAFEGVKDSLMNVASTCFQKSPNVLKVRVRTTPRTEQYITQSYGPLLKTCWGQGEPYNGAIKKKKGQNCKVGCVAVATGQVMGYYNFPSKMNVHGVPYFFNWNRMIVGYDANSLSEEGLYDLQCFLYCVAEGVNAKYGIDETSALFGNANRLLNDYFSTNKKSYNLNDVVSSVKEGRPVLMCGRQRFKLSGHAWVIDGCRVLQTRYILDNRCILTSNADYIHHNWGWDGSCNGWFAAGVFDPDDCYDRTGMYSSSSHDNYSRSQDIILVRKK